MFKKLKDKLAEEVKSSPQRIQQFAQAAQAAVNSASSSISDITNNDLFSIGESESKPNRPNGPESQVDTFQSVPLQAPLRRANVEAMNYHNEYSDAPRHRKLSNSSFASDVSFKLPSYESPVMYHLQSDMDVSASEAEERSLTSPGGVVSLDHVTKEQLYAAYRRTQERYSKYRSRYADLARHYKVLERENAKAKSVLVETQDKALRRISELREQCSLEQSAKAHLESALRVELDEKTMKIESLCTKIKLLQENNIDPNMNTNSVVKTVENDPQLIDLTDDNSNQNETNVLTIKIEKMEQLLNKYKESVKSLKERNSQITTELQVMTSNLERKVKENEELKNDADAVETVKKEIDKLKEINEGLQNTVNAYEFNKVKEIASLETDLKQAHEEITDLKSRIEVFNKREEEYAISLAENKLSIHKELESKEAEIKSLKDSVSTYKKEVQSLNIIINEYKQNRSLLEEEKVKLTAEIAELTAIKNKFPEMEKEIRDLTIKCEMQEGVKNKTTEETKCLELQLKQETAEKLAMIDRNAYLEDRNKQILEDNVKKNTTIAKLDKQIQDYNNALENSSKEESESFAQEKYQLLNEVTMWKDKFNTLQCEIHDERVELVKLQKEIEKLLRNHEMIQSENSDLHDMVTKLQSENTKLLEMKRQSKITTKALKKLQSDMNIIKLEFSSMSNQAKSLLTAYANNEMPYFKNEVNAMLKNIKNRHDIVDAKYEDVIKQLNDDINQLNLHKNSLESELTEAITNYSNNVQEKNRNDDEKSKVILEMTAKIESLTQENESLIKQWKQISNDLSEIGIKHSDIEMAHNNLCVENSLLKEKHEKLLKENDILNERVLTLEQKCQEHEDKHKYLEEIKLVENQSYKEQLNKLTNDRECLESEYINVQALNKTLKDDNNLLQEKCEHLKQEKECLHEKILIADQEIQKYESRLEHLNEMVSTAKENNLLKAQLNKISTDFNDIQKKHEDVTNSVNVINDENNVLYEKCEHLKQEKEALYERFLASQKTCQDYESTINLLEDRVSKEEEVKLAIEQLESTLNQMIQKCEELEEENKNLQAQVQLQKNNLIESELFPKVTEHNFIALQGEYEILKEDKSRLLSEIEGMQNHLQKVSKDNSQLNDQLREIIANSESSNVQDKAYEHEEKQKINDLIRENTILAEKNLELQDCINSHHLNIDNMINKNAQQSSHKELEIIELQEKYNGLLEIKMQLESKLAEMELVGRSGDKSSEQLQEKNEKLRLTNEKLERRLDEALVSLRHFRALEESTELEYLRNILYEYLTGSGSHSETLAKVISAVVKFDSKQTQTVLQKEKERQGLLRQLGLL